MAIKSTKEYINGFEWEINIIPSTDPELYVDGVICRGTTEEVCDFIACWADLIYSFVNNIYRALYCEDG